MEMLCGERERGIFGRFCDGTSRQAEQDFQISGDLLKAKRVGTRKAVKKLNAECVFDKSLVYLLLLLFVQLLLSLRRAPV